MKNYRYQVLTLLGAKQRFARFPSSGQAKMTSRSVSHNGLMVRNALASDIASIQRLMRTIPGFWQPWWSEKTLRDAIQSANGLAFVWESDSQILGFICAHDFGFRAYLSELVVDTSIQRQGIGTRLLRAVEESLRSRSQRVLIADVWHEAEPFYKSLGWQPPDAVLLGLRLRLSD